MAIPIAKDRVVKIAYRITDTEGRLLDERTPADQYEYIHGRGVIVPPVERVLVGHTAGHRAEVSVSPREAYGDYRPELVTEVSREDFPRGLKVEVGMKFNTSNENGEAMIIRVIEIDDTSVTVDGNHPLAGLNLIFDVRILDVREATPRELETGVIGDITIGTGWEDPEGGSSGSLH